MGTAPCHRGIEECPLPTPHRPTARVPGFDRLYGTVPLYLFLDNSSTGLGCFLCTQWCCCDGQLHCTSQRKRTAMLMTCTGGFARKSRHSLITSPTKNAVQQVVRCRCAHNQAMIRNNDNLANQTIPDRRRRAMIGRRMETRSGSQW